MTRREATRSKSSLSCLATSGPYGSFYVFMAFYLLTTCRRSCNKLATCSEPPALLLPFPSPPPSRGHYVLTWFKLRRRTPLSSPSVSPDVSFACPLWLQSCIAITPFSPACTHRRRKWKREPIHGEKEHIAAVERLRAEQAKLPMTYTVRRTARLTRDPRCCLFKAAEVNRVKGFETWRVAASHSIFLKVTTKP